MKDNLEPVFQLAVSSTNTEVLTPLGLRSLIATINSNGLITDPCGTPFSTSLESASVDPTLTCICRSERKL